jgi:outer membrane protein
MPSRALSGWVVAASCLACVTGTARAQVAAVPLSLDDAVARAVATAPRLAEARARIAAADAARASRQTQGGPTVVASASYERTNHVDQFGLPQAGGGIKVLFPDIPDNYRARAELAVPLLTSGRIDALVASAADEQRATEADRDTATGDVRLDVTRAYWTLVIARASVRVVEQALSRADAWVGDVKSSVDAGLLAPNEYESARAQRARESVQLIRAKNAEAMAQADLGRLTGLGPDAPIATTTDLDAPVSGAATLMAQPIDALVARARQGRTEREALRLRADSADATGTAAVDAAKPQVGLVGGVQPARPNQLFVPRADVWNTSWDIAVNVSWQLWDNGRSRADRAAAHAQAEAIRRRLDDFDALLAVEIRQRVLDLRASEAALQASSEAVAASTEAHRVVAERFRAGVATSTDVLDAQVALLQAELEHTQIVADLRLGEARLVRAVGK